MVNRILHDLLLCTVSGTLMLILSIPAGRLMRGKSMEKWNYAVLITSLVLFFIPLSGVQNIPKAMSVEIPADTVAMEVLYGAALPHAQQSERDGLDISIIIFAAWAAVCAALIIKNIICYVKADRRIRRICRDIRDDEIISAYEDVCALMRIRPRARLVSCKDISTPMLFGVIKPLLIMPEREFCYDETEMIFAHELTHYRHRDIYIKLAALAVRCVHWFNPAAYFLSGAVNRACELCCDESVLRLLEPSDKKDYGRLLLSVMEGGSETLGAYSTSMASSKKHIKSRLTKIAQFKEATNMIKAIGILTAVSMAVCSVTAFGFTQAAELVPENVARILEPTVTPKPESTPEILPAAESEETPAAQPAVLQTPAAETEAPEISREYEIIPDTDETEYTEQSAEAVPEEEIIPEAAVPEEEPQSYSFENEEYISAPEENAELPEEETQIKEVKISEESGYILSPDFENGADMVEITAESDARLRITRGNTDVNLKILRADTMEVLGESGEQYGGLSLNVKQGERYILEMFGESGADAKVYIYSYK